MCVRPCSFCAADECEARGEREVRGVSEGSDRHALYIFAISPTQRSGERVSILRLHCTLRCKNSIIMKTELHKTEKIKAGLELPAVSQLVPPPTSAQAKG